MIEMIIKIKRTGQFRYLKMHKITEDYLITVWSNESPCALGSQFSNNKFQQRLETSF